MNKFPIGSQWETHGGWRAVIVDHDGERPIVWHSKDKSVRDCDINGYDYDGYGIGPGVVTDTHFTPTPWKEPAVHEGWINIYPSNLHKTKKEATTKAWGGRRLACLPIKFAQREGL